MNIRNVRDKFKHFGTLSIAQLSAVTGETISDLQFVVQELLQKEKIKVTEIDQSCGGGCSCSSSKAEKCSTKDQLYSWVKQTVL